MAKVGEFSLTMKPILPNDPEKVIKQKDAKNLKLSKNNSTASSKKVKVSVNAS